jgi:hypothetical protein
MVSRTSLKLFKKKALLEDVPYTNLELPDLRVIIIGRIGFCGILTIHLYHREAWNVIFILAFIL